MADEGCADVVALVSPNFIYFNALPALPESLMTPNHVDAGRIEKKICPPG